MKQMIKFILLALSILAFVSCQKCEKNVPIKKITLNLQEGDPPSLNPYIGVDLRSRTLYLTLFEPLMRSGDNGLEPAAAQSVDVDETQTIYTFHIRPHRWSNGEPVTSHHFAEAWRYALRPLSHCFRADLFYPIKNGEKVKKGELPENTLGLETPNAHTLIVTLEHPTPYFLDLAASSFYSPLYYPSDEEPLHFNGPFMVKERVPDQKLILKSNPLYWDASSIQLQEICFTMVRDPMTAVSMYEKGDLDLVGDPFSPLPFDMIPTLETSDRLHKKTVSRIFYLLLNTDAYPLNVKSLRKALALSIDRDLLTQHLFFGEIPTLTALPTTLSSMDNQDNTHNVEQCVQLFEQALSELHLSREHLPKIVLSYAELSGQKKLAEFVQAQWKTKLGLDIEIVCNEWNVHASNLRRGTYQIGTLHLTTLFQDPMFYFDLFRDKCSLCNYCRWENATFRDLLEASEQNIDATTRRRYLHEAEQQLLEEMPVIALFTQNFQYLVRDDLDLAISELGIYDFKNAQLQ